MDSPTTSPQDQTQVQDLKLPQLSRRERELLDIIFRLRNATVTEIMAEMEAPPTRAAVRFLLRVMEEKGHIVHSKKGREFVYTATRPRSDAGKSALHNVLTTFFDGSLRQGIGAYLSDPNAAYSKNELEEISKLIASAKDSEHLSNPNGLS